MMSSGDFSNLRRSVEFRLSTCSRVIASVTGWSAPPKEKRGPGAVSRASFTLGPDDAPLEPQQFRSGAAHLQVLRPLRQRLDRHERGEALLDLAHSAAHLRPGRSVSD